MSVSGSLRHSPALWRPLRHLLRRVVDTSARRVLASRRDPGAAAGTARWPAGDIERLLAGADAWALRLRPAARLEALPTVGSRLMVELAVLSTAVYRALLDRGQPRAAARRLAAEIGWDAYARGLRLASLPARLTTRDPGERLKRTIRLMLRFPFTPSGAPGYEAECWTEGDRIFTHWTCCPPQEAVRRIVTVHGDRGDLQAFSESWCRYDWPGADLIAADGRGGHYRRTRTLSRGDAVCDMCWSGTPVGTGAPAAGDERAMDIIDGEGMLA